MTTTWGQLLLFLIAETIFRTNAREKINLNIF